MKKSITAFIGPIGSGKDYRCALLEQQGYQKIAFADSLRELTWAILDFTPRDSNDYERFKMHTLEGMTYASEYESYKYKIELTGREFLQRLGTDARKILDEDIWLKAFKKKIEESKHDKFCVSDLKFENELEFIKSLGDTYNVEIIFTNYKSPRYNCTDPHDSEKLAQEFLRQEYDDGDIIFKSFNPKVGDMVMLVGDVGIHKAGQTAEILEVNPYNAYPYIVELADDTELSVTKHEITQIF
jgi:hypothetical protein